MKFLNEFRKTRQAVRNGEPLFDMKADELHRLGYQGPVWFNVTEVRVVIEDWRFKYNHVRPHRSLGYVTPIQFAGLALEASPLTAPVVSTRRSLDVLYNLKETLTPPRLTNYAAQFG